MKTLAKQQSHIAQIRKMNLTQIETVCQLLGWSHDDYTQHQYLEYEMFIAKACVDAPEYTDYLRYSEDFCGFYINEWIKRNRISFLPFAKHTTDDVIDSYFDGEKFEVRLFPALEPGDIELIDEYIHTHNYQSLFCDADFQKRYEYEIDKLLCHA